MQGIQVAGGTHRSDQQKELQRKFPTMIGMCRRGLCAVGPEWTYMNPEPQGVMVMIPTDMAERFFSQL